MKTLFLECNMGIAGDMLCGALLDLMSDKQKENAINKANSFIDGVTVSINKSEKCGIYGTKFDVEINERGHHHSSVNEIYNIIDSFDVSDKVKVDAKNVYSIIASAESKVHNISVADVHLHEIGAKDAIIDVTLACYLIDELNIDYVISTPITTGFGEVVAEHGIMPVPAPATAEILKGIEFKTGNIEGELCTPTGAALVKYFAKEITNDVELNIESVGYGMGKKNFAKPNCVRAVLSSKANYVYELKCQIDDMTGEEMGFAINKFIELGALDAFVKPIVMKKSRPAFELVAITSADKKDYFTTQIFKHTTTLGVRQIKCVRNELGRECVEINGVSVKKSFGYGVEKSKPEFDEIARIANEKDISIFDVKKELFNA